MKRKNLWLVILAMAMLTTLVGTAFGQSLPKSQQKAIAVASKSLQDCLEKERTCQGQLEECLSARESDIEVFKELAAQPGCMNDPDCTPDKYRAKQCRGQSPDKKKSVAPPVKTIYCPSSMVLLEKIGKAEAAGDAVSTYSQRRNHVCVATFVAAKRAFEYQQEQLKALCNIDERFSKEEREWLIEQGYVSDLEKQCADMGSALTKLVSFVMHIREKEVDPDKLDKMLQGSSWVQEWLNDYHVAAAVMEGRVSDLERRMNGVEKKNKEQDDRLDEVEEKVGLLAKPLEVQLGVGADFTARKGPYDSYGPYVWGHLLLWGDPNDGLAIRGAVGQAKADTTQELQWQVGGLWVHDFMDDKATVHLRSNLGAIVQGEAPLERHMDSVGVDAVGGLELLIADWFVLRGYAGLGGERHTLYASSPNGPVATPEVSDVEPQYLFGLEAGVAF